MPEIMSSPHRDNTDATSFASVKTRRRLNNTVEFKKNKTVFYFTDVKILFVFSINNYCYSLKDL